MTADVAARIVDLANRLGEPSLDYVLLAEGNCSAQVDDGSFLVKASGTEMGTAGAADFVRVACEPVLRLVESDAQPGDAEIRDALEAAKVERSDARPSVETFLHAVCLQLEDVAFVGHTHPTAINKITCSRDFEAALSGRLFPDEIVVDGPAALLVPYTDPGLPLARAIRERIAAYRTRHGERPRTIYMQNHGFIALGSSAKQVLDVTAMAVKAARILAGTYSLGGPRFLKTTERDRIHQRPDEHYRQRQLDEEEPS